MEDWITLALHVEGQIAAAGLNSIIRAREVPNRKIEYCILWNSGC